MPGVEVRQNPDVQLTVVIPHLNYSKLDRCVKTLKKYTPPIYRVILVDQSDNDYSWMIKEGLVHMIVKAYRNLGFAKACNTGLRLADTEYVMCLNDDVEFIHRNWWPDLLGSFKARPDAGAINPHSFVNPHGNGNRVIQWEVKDPLGDNPYTDEDYQGMKTLFSGTPPGREQIYPAGCMYAPVFRREILMKLGQKEGSPCGIALFDESYGAGSGEDYQMCRRLGIMGHEFVGSHRSFVLHWWGETKNNMPVDKSNPVTNYQLISGGYNRMKEQWGPPRGSAPGDTPDGWDTRGLSGPKYPLNGQPWSTIVSL